MTQPPPNERVRQRIAEWVAKEGYGSQRRLANHVPAKFGEPRHDQWVSDILKSRADVRLKDLDAVADVLGVPPGKLVSRNDRNYEECTMAESKLLRYFRSLPDTVRHGFLSWLDYFFRSQEQAAQGATEQRETRTAKARRQEQQAARAQKMR